MANRLIAFYNAFLIVLFFIAGTMATISIAGAQNPSCYYNPSCIYNSSSPSCQ